MNYRMNYRICKVCVDISILKTVKLIGLLKILDLMSLIKGVEKKKVLLI